MVYTKEEFKRLWEADESGGGITNDDCADCAKAWGLYSIPRCARIDEVVYRVCEAAGAKESHFVRVLNQQETMSAVSCLHLITKRKICSAVPKC